MTCTGTSKSSVSVLAGRSARIYAYYDVGDVGTGTLTLTATSQATEIPDDGYYNVPVVNKGAPQVSLKNHNRDNRDRSLCLTSGAGEAAAWQCGDLLVAHGLPGYATLGRERSLTLLYNSAQAVPKPVVVAEVDQQGLTAPDSVIAELRVSGVLRASASYVNVAGARQRDRHRLRRIR